MKGYICRWERRKEPHSHVMDYWFDHRPEKAAFWRTKEEADADCMIFNREGITIPSSEGGSYLCNNFRSEERSPGEFVIFCEAPFIGSWTDECVGRIRRTASD
jgi:hypothetical protein